MSPKARRLMLLFLTASDCSGGDQDVKNYACILKHSKKNKASFHEVTFPPNDDRLMMSCATDIAFIR